jgi:hypothetical protein
MIDTTIGQNTFLNSVVYEGKILSDWINHFKIDFSGGDVDVLTTFISKSSEANYLYGKIKPYFELIESKLKKKYNEEKVLLVESYTLDKTKRVPNLEILDSMVKDLLKKQYEELDIAKYILTTFEIIIKNYEQLSYLVSKKFS